jgi:hypothetical protein
MSASETQVAAHLDGLSDQEFQSAYSHIMGAAKEAGITGFGGSCWAAAVAINRVIFSGHGRLLAGLNVALLEGSSHTIGHAAVLARKACWDLDGRPKEEDEIEAWGMLDFSDSDYAKLFTDNGLVWNEQSANDAGLWEVAEIDFIRMTKLDAVTLQAAVDELRSVAESWFANLQESAGLQGPSR